MNPTDPIAAVTHRDPYPYYAALVDGPPLVFDATLGLWVASSAASVSAVLGHPACRVRPLAAPVPPALCGTTAGELFAQLIRMNDGALRHDVPKRAMQAALAAVDTEALRRRASVLAAQRRPARGPDALDAWCMTVPVCAVADLLGFDDARLDGVAAWVTDFVAALSPLSTDAQLARASDAAGHLLERMTALVAASRTDDRSLVAAVQHAARDVGWHASGALIANLVGLLSQTCEATAAWLGNTLAAWLDPGHHPDGGGIPVDDEAALDAFVAEVARFDAPVQNTRRFVAARTTLAGVTVDAGDAILVVLAAANRDPAVHRDPHRFVPGRPPGPAFGFGAGPHGCPGERIARAVTAGAVGALLRAGGLPPRDALSWRYRASTNVRMPKFEAAR
ncbi:cytochrome P450 [Burkholderia stagnalis]|uniref:cytochrome P450 n=1 Tax=Burkholderia stagnalis TaxID=1503054 RepID=UPI000F585F95|nr:cytochrome P450 [Burkholderia stagnalis]RQQ21699.1 cytochrome P450 [Burkholderia stagnalis]RQQ23391.1 cytochrome P450 [Burkholderia stagnalis]RQQ41971.1 cytochrome P450 [Burkholderia stagnalis]RQX87882.1 cytochrome P450 [Burkholderia stagnalis]RQY04978.1 cytochrome P450 [Burkholderia stagnalis]